jgi:2-polyprenyl-3-methyl-5-hydroxy-6-metoxy-1,4-benzoquinol methylase
MICSNENSKIVLETKGHKLHRCLACNLIFSTENNPQKLETAKVYREYYQKENASRFGGVIERVVKAFRYLRAYRIATLRPNAKSILDIGSGRGWMLYFLKKYFKFERTAGTQIAENAYRFSKEKLQLEIYNADLLKLDFSEKFDVVSILHVLEHVKKPEAYVEKMYELLNDKGLLFLEVPNYNAWSRILTNQHWLALDLKHHLFFFTPSSLTNLLLKYNFKIKKIRTFSLEYSAFTSTQSLVNMLTNTDSYFFKWLQKRNFELKIIWHILLFIILFLPCFLINLALYFSKYGEVLTIVAEKNANRNN